jgi:FkbM family methyltransferase
MNTRIRVAYLRGLRMLGVRSFVATSGLGRPFVCHVGDSLGENPFYNPRAFRTELEVCAAWSRQYPAPSIFDVGANVGFWSTQLAQMLGDRGHAIFAFEPVPSTFAKLVESVERLQLADRLHVIAGAVGDSSGIVRLSYSPFDSMLARVDAAEVEHLPGTRAAYAPCLTLDEFSSSVSVTPDLLKIDVEGSELRALRGARRMLHLPNRPGIMFEYNPKALFDAGEDASSFAELLSGYVLHYVDDFEGQRRPFAQRVESTGEIGWVCNLFAVPSHESGLGNWQAAVALAGKRLQPSGR